MTGKAAKFFMVLSILSWLGSTLFWPSFIFGVIFFFIALGIKREDQKKETNKALAETVDFFKNREEVIRREERGRGLKYDGTNGN